MAPSVTRSLSLLATATIASAIGLPDVLFRDVVVVGGGASGAYAAVSLKDDYGMSVSLIEKQSILGGHVDTFVDPSTQDPYNYGVQSFIDMGNATAFFDKLGVEMATPGHTTTTTTYVDFSTGQQLNYTLPSSADQLAALATYCELAEQYEDILLPGYFDFPEADAIPEDLLLPFGDFAAKYSIEKAMPYIYKITGLGTGDITAQLTIWVMQSFGAPMARAILGTQASFVPASGSNQELYEAIDDHLGDDVLKSSTVIASWRTDYGVFLTVQNSETGKLTLITARRLLVAIMPTPANLAPFNLDATESAVLDRLEYLRIYAGIVSNDALPVNYTLFNLPAAAQPSDWTVYPTPSFLARFDYIGENKYFRIMFIGEPDVDAAAAKAAVQADLDRMISSGVLTEPAGSSSALQWVAIEDHGLTSAHVSADELRSGFIQDMYALQGRRATWYTGAAWGADFQTSLWAFDDVLLPKLVADMQNDGDFTSLDFSNAPAAA